MLQLGLKLGLHIKFRAKDWAEIELGLRLSKKMFRKRKETGDDDGAGAELEGGC